MVVGVVSMVQLKSPVQFVKRIVGAGGSCSSVVEHWQLKPGVLGLIPSDYRVFALLYFSS